MTACISDIHRLYIRNRYEHDLKSFLTPGNCSANTWLYVQDTAVYLRKSVRADPKTNERLKCIDIANVNVEPQGQGIFTIILGVVCKMSHEYGYEGIYIENVMTDRFAKFFRKLGYTEISPYKGVPPCFLLRF